MLRPAVAATNCVRAGKTSGLDIGRRRLWAEKTPDMAMQGIWPCRACPVHKLPGRGEAVNDGRKTALSAGRRTPAKAGREPNFWPGLAGIPDKTSLFPRIS